MDFSLEPASKKNVCARTRLIKTIQEQGTCFLRTFIHYVKARTAPIYCFPIATLISVILGSEGNLNPYIVASIVAASYWLGLATYVYNDLTDFEVDKINRTKRPSVTGKATKNQLIITVCVMFSTGLGIAASINFYTFGVSIIFTVLAIIYSHPKFKLKNKFALKTVITASGAGLLSLMGGMAMLNTSLPILYSAFAFFVFYFILSPLGDIADIIGDRAVGRRTFPIVLGMKPTLIIMLSVPIVIIILIALSFDALQINITGAFSVIITAAAVIAVILKINRRLNDVHYIKSLRPKMRYLNILMQISMLLAFL
jgi:geranylgeranylglycerol-phosphate geranylgeranyltransferase